MNYLQKLFMLTVLGLGVYVNETLCPSPEQEEIQAKIHNVIAQKSLSFKENGNLEQLLSAIQSELKLILQSAPDNEYKELKDAVDKLNPKNLLTALTSINTILKNIAPETKALIMKHIPANLRSFVG